VTFLEPETLAGVLDDLAARGIAECDHDLAMYAWPQTWASSALGFGGVGGQMITSAVTIVMVVDHQDAYVYFGGTPAYRCSWRVLSQQVFRGGFPAAPSVRESIYMDPAREVLRPIRTEAPGGC